MEKGWIKIETEERGEKETCFWSKILETTKFVVISHKIKEKELNEDDLDKVGNGQDIEK
jgi:hypothetical protein